MKENSANVAGYITELELAKRFGRDQRTLKRWHEQKIGPPRTTIGRLVLYREQAVADWLLQNEQKGRGKSRKVRGARDSKVELVRV